MLSSKTNIEEIQTKLGIDAFEIREVCPTCKEPIIIKENTLDIETYKIKKFRHNCKNCGMDTEIDICFKLEMHIKKSVPSI